MTESKRFLNSIVPEKRFKQGGVTRAMRHLQEREQVLQIEVSHLERDMTHSLAHEAKKIFALELINAKGRLAEVEALLLWIDQNGERADDVDGAVLRQIEKGKVRHRILSDNDIYNSVLARLRGIVKAARGN